MTTYSSIFAWRILWTEEPGRLTSLGSQRAGHDLVSEHTHTHMQTHTHTGRLLLYCFLFDFHSFSVYSCTSYMLTNQMNRCITSCITSQCIFVNKHSTLSRDQIFCLMAISDVSGKAQIRSPVDFSSGEGASLWGDVI